MNTFKIEEKDGSTTEYVKDHNGVIKQLYPKPYVYDKTYVQVYDTPEYKRRNQALQRLRLGFVEAMYDAEIKALVDVGYGNGAFLKYVQVTESIDTLLGNDVSHVDPPKGVDFVSSATLMDKGYFDIDVATFWDCLEHFPDLSFLADLSVGMIVVSLPHCHFNSIPNKYPVSKTANIEWFTNWHHRKPNEHLHHFDKISLEKTMAMYGWRCIGATAIEDTVRKPRDNHKNILTAAFKR